jgi:hypothetical protein
MDIQILWDCNDTLLLYDRLGIVSHLPCLTVFQVFFLFPIHCFVNRIVYYCCPIPPDLRHIRNTYAYTLPKKKNMSDITTQTGVEEASITLFGGDAWGG